MQTYREIINTLFAKLPMYQRIGKAAYKANLTTTISLDKVLGQPHRSYKTIHLAGTNGKGSTSHMLASILQQAGYKTGLYTSPHLLDFRERIKVDGKMIPENEVVQFYQNYQSKFDTHQPSFFEWTWAMASWYFQQQKVDIAVIETGMGGRLDSTNIIRPILSIITNIGMDHQQFLGDSRPQIAAEKAGIIKQNTPVIIGNTESKFHADGGEVKQVFTERATELHAPIHFVDQSNHELPACDLTGNYQQENIRTALTAARQLVTSGLAISEDNIKRGLASVSISTGLRGRFEQLGINPKIIVDTAHNQDGITAVVAQLNELKGKNLHLVLGSTSEKNAEEFLAYWPSSSIFYLTQAKIPRSKPVDQLQETALFIGLQSESHAIVEEAISAAQKAAKPDDIIFIGGSTFVVAEALEFFD